MTNVLRQFTGLAEFGDVLRLWRDADVQEAVERVVDEADDVADVVRECLASLRLGRVA